MLKARKLFEEELFPILRLPPPGKFADRLLKSAEHEQGLASLRATVAATYDEIKAKDFRDIANSKMNDETARQASIIARAQGLFVALAVFGFLFTFGAGLLTQNADLRPWVLWICALLVVFIIAQMIVMVFNILQAIRGIDYPTFGKSDLVAWLSAPDRVGFYRQQGLLTLEHCRVASLNNTWRMHYLQFALKGLRNIVFALSILVMFFFFSAIIAPTTSPAPSSIIVLPSCFGCSSCRFL